MTRRSWLALALAAACVLLIPVAWAGPVEVAVAVTAFQLSCVGINGWLVWGELRALRRRRDGWR